MKTSETSTISNIFVWSATLFAPISAFYIFEGWKTQHNKSVERSLAEESSLNLRKIEGSLGQIYFIMYLNKITHPYFYPVTDKPVPEYIIKNILDFNEEVIDRSIDLKKNLNRLSRKNQKLKKIFQEYSKEYNNLHSNLFYFIDLKIQGKLPDISQEASKQKFVELYDHYHSFHRACEELDSVLDQIIFV